VKSYKMILVVGVLLAGVAGLAACSSEEARRDAILALVADAEWEQVRDSAEVLRQDGVVAPWLDYAEGLGALHLGAEQRARRLLNEAVEADPALAPEVAAAWSSLAYADYEAGWRDRARERMSQAVLVDPTTDPGPMLGTVADYLYRHIKMYDEASPLYERLYNERPEPANRHAEWVYRWGHCLELRDDLNGARAVYEEFVQTWPRDTGQGRFVHWRYQDVLLTQAREAREAGDLDGAIEIALLVRQGNWHMDQQQRAEYLIGQIREQQGELDLAREHYELVLEHAKVVGTDIVDPARARLEALDAISEH